MAEKYITEEQRARCRTVADAFAELYDLTDVVVADAGRFGFVRLQFFRMGKSSREESEKAGSKNRSSDTSDSNQILSEGRNII